MYTGPFDDEPCTVELMDRFLEEQGYINNLNKERMHHEIYLPDVKKQIQRNGGL